MKHIDLNDRTRLTTCSKTYLHNVMTNIIKSIETADLYALLKRKEKSIDQESL